MLRKIIIILYLSAAACCHAGTISLTDATLNDYDITLSTGNFFMDGGSLEPIIGMEGDNTTTVGNFMIEDTGSTHRWKISMYGTDAASYADDLQFRYNYGTGYSAKMAITDGGSVGIGTASPSSMFHISGSSPKVRLTDTDTGAICQLNPDSSAGSMSIDADQGNTVANSRLYFNVDGTSQMTIEDSGEVGIGTTTPSALLHLYSEAPVLAATCTNASSGFRINVLGLDGDSDDLLRVQDANTTIFQIEKNGKTGIGMTNPTSSLVVAGNIDNAPDTNGVHLGLSGVYSCMELAGSGGSFIDFTEAGSDFDGRILYANTTDTMSFYVGTSAKAYITPTGLGIGTNNPFYALQVNGGGEDYVAQVVSTDAGSYIRFTDDTKTGYIGEYAGQLVFMPDVTGALSYRMTTSAFYANNTLTASCGTTTKPWTVVYADNGTIQASDATLKEDIATLSSVSAIVDNIEPVSWIFKDRVVPDEIKTVTKQKVSKVVEEVEEITYQEIDGKLVKVKTIVSKEKEIPVFEEKPIFNPDGKAIAKEDGLQEVIKVPVMETVEETTPGYTIPSDGKTHFGVTTQAVAAALSAAGFDPTKCKILDYGNGYDQDPTGLIYSELIGILWADHKALKADVADLKARVTALEAQK